MKARWIISGHHLALQAEDKILHPDAKEIYSFVTSACSEAMGYECGSPLKELSNIRFSKIGSPIRVLLSNSKDGSIIIELFAVRRGQIIPIDVIDGIIIDQCVSDDTWFFLNGNKEEIQSLLEEADIKTNGKISIHQYLKIEEKSIFSKLDYIDNKVNIDELKRPVNNQELAPQTLRATLYPYQHTGYLWLKDTLESTKGCILGDEMGLGKTMQVIAEILYLKSVGRTPVLVVAPISLLENWKRECEKFAPSLSVYIHYGKDRISNYKEFYHYDVVVTSYTTIVADINMLNMMTWQLVVLDEAQNIKNPESARTQNCKVIRRERSLAVSGTPFENHVSDIWSIVDFVIPGLLGSLKSYQQAISDDIDGGQKIEPILSPIMLRRLVADVAKDLPEKVVSTQPLQMSDEEAQQYSNYVKELSEKFDVENINLGMLQKLRIFCAHPFAVEDKNLQDDPAKYSVKYQRFCEIVEEITCRNEKVLVFTSYKSMFSIFKKDVPLRFGIPIWTINGETPVEERQSIVDNFNTLSGSAILILNPRAAGTGLNITGANHVIHYNLEWNPSLEDQSSARAYRRGQNKTVFIYRLYYKDTIEQVINERIERKRKIADSAIVGTDGKSQDREDIIRAIKLIPKLKNNK